MSSQAQAEALHSMLSKFPELLGHFPAPAAAGGGTVKRKRQDRSQETTGMVQVVQARTSGSSGKRTQSVKSSNDAAKRTGRRERSRKSRAAAGDANADTKTCKECARPVVPSNNGFAPPASAQQAAAGEC